VIKPLNILVGCEYSGKVRDALIARGHNAISCDIIPSEGNPDNPHYLGDVLELLDLGWDMGIFFPPCTYLATSGNRWFKVDPTRYEKRELALQFFQKLLDAPIPQIAIENPLGVVSTRIKKPSQIIQPWQYGHGETKRTCLWLKNLPLLRPTNIVDGREHRIHHLTKDNPDRQKLRSLTYDGIALAMAEQWTPDIIGSSLSA